MMLPPRHEAGTTMIPDACLFSWSVKHATGR